jgi:predicted AlkP superfamily pyrophosphatase or phosphodiesterase
MTRFLLLLSLTSGLAAYANEPAQDGPVRAKVLLISVDGLRPEFYRSPEFTTPNLKHITEAGASADGSQPVYPSLTYPNHTTIVTGVSSARHGVPANTLFSRETGPTKRWYWEASHIRVPTVWQRAQEAGLQVAMFSWPVTMGANVRWNIPEFFSVPGLHTESTWEMTRKEMRPEFVQELMADPEIRALGSLEQVNSFAFHDRFITAAAVHVLRKHQPDLTLVHLLGVDSAQHDTGRDSPETRKAIEEVDRQVGQLLAAVDLNATTVLITGDHGFLDYRKLLNINALFVRKGWIRLDPKGAISDWKVMAHSGSGHAAIYVKDPKLAGPALRLLKRSEGQGYRVVSREELTALKAYPDAICAVDAHEGYIIRGAQDAGAPLLSDAPHVQGQHGYSPTMPRMKTGFLAIGVGVRPGLRLKETRLLDLAPTVAGRLGFSMTEAEGQALELGAERK